MIKTNNKPYTRESSRRSWSGGPRSSGVGFFCFHALEDTKQKKLTPLDRGLPLHVNRVFNSSALEKWTVVTSTRTQDIFNVHFNTNQWIWSYISLTEQICRVVKVASTWIRLKKHVFKNVRIPAGGGGGWGRGLVEFENTNALSHRNLFLLNVSRTWMRREMHALTAQK